MSEKLKESIKANAIALAVAAPMAYLAQIAMGIQMSAWHTLFYSMLWLAVLELVSWNRLTAVGIPLAVLVLGAAVWLLFGNEQRQAFIDFYQWAIGFIKTGGPTIPDYTSALSALGAFAVSLFVWLFGRKFPFFPVVFLFVAGLTVIKWLQGLDLVLMPGLLAGGGLMMLWTKSIQRRTAKEAGAALPVNGIAVAMLPFAVIIALLSSSIVTDERAKAWQSKPVYEVFQRVNNIIADYTHFNHPRNSFSISIFGFMPMGGRLGGPSRPSPIEVLSVSAPSRILLRGVVYNTYTGNTWQDTTDSQPLRFSDENFAGAQEAFDNGPLGITQDAFSPYVKDITVRVKPLVDLASTLFIPCRGVYSVTSDKFLAILPRFNALGEAFSSGDVLEGYSYTVKARYLAYESRGFGAAMSNVLRLGLKDAPEKEDSLRKNFLSLPPNISQTVYDIVDRIAKGETITLPFPRKSQTQTTAFATWTPPPVSNQYELAMAIKAYLSENYPYTLTPDYPPEQSDFVSYFVTQNPKGYCTYFASAMAVMARIAGIPSRYVEGYLMPEKQQSASEYVVSGTNAHAWAELYFSGVGWIPFDATPSGSGINTELDSGAASNLPLPTPTLPVKLDTGGVPAPTPKASQSWASASVLFWGPPAALALLAALLLAARVLLASARVSPGRVNRKYTDNNKRCIFYYQEMLRLLAGFFKPVEPGETPQAYASHVDERIHLAEGSFTNVAELMLRISYSEYAATDREVNRMALYREELARRIRRAVGLPEYLWRYVLRHDRRVNRRHGNKADG